VGFDVRVVEEACFVLPQPTISTSTGSTTGISARGLKDRCITADIERVDEA
jgi:hypothetical protein